jgi:hypothetical protein
MVLSCVYFHLKLYSTERQTHGKFVVRTKKSFRYIANFVVLNFVISRCLLHFVYGEYARTKKIVRCTEHFGIHCHEVWPVISPTFWDLNGTFLCQLLQNNKLEVNFFSFLFFLCWTDSFWKTFCWKNLWLKKYSIQICAGQPIALPNIFKVNLRNSYVPRPMKDT